MIKFSPLHPGAYTDRGIALLMLGRNEDALDSFSQAVRVWNGPASMMERFFPIENTAGSRSLTLFSVPNTARGLSRQDVGPDSPGAGHGPQRHGAGLSSTGTETRRRSASTTVRSQIYPSDPNAFIGRGDCHLALGEADRALADYNEAVRLGPGYSRAYASRGKLLETKGDWDKAEADYDRAIQLDPSFTYAFACVPGCSPAEDRTTRPWPTPRRPADRAPRCRRLKDRGGILVRTGQYQQAIEELNKAIELNPKLATAYLNRGAAYNSLGQYERAIKDLDKALELDPKNAPAHTNIGLAYYMVGQYDRAVEDLSEAVRLAPKNAVVHFNRANVYARLGLQGAGPRRLRGGRPACIRN